MSRFYKFIEEGKGYEGFPDNWTKDSVESWVNTFADNHGGSMPKDSDWWDKCVSAMEDEEGIDDPEAICAKIKDAYLGSEDWRGED